MYWGRPKKNSRKKTDKYIVSQEQILKDHSVSVIYRFKQMITSASDIIGLDILRDSILWSHSKNEHFKNLKWAHINKNKNI